jgi:hypothetical protein
VWPIGNLKAEISFCEWTDWRALDPCPWAAQECGTVVAGMEIGGVVKERSCELYGEIGIKIEGKNRLVQWNKHIVRDMVERRQPAR